MDTSMERAIFVTLPDGRKMKFKECDNGLYYFDAKDEVELPKDKNIKEEVKNYSNEVNLLSTVAENKSLFSRREIQGAKNARILQQSLGWPSTTTYKSYVKNNLIRNCGVTIDDIERSLKIYGTPVPLIKGKMTNIGPTTNDMSVTYLPPDIIEHHRHIQLYMDFFYVNKMPFLHTKSGKINYLTVASTKSRSKGIIVNEIQRITNIYKKRGFSITKYHGDNEFDMNDLREMIRPSVLHICANEEHVYEVERSIRTIKERCRCACHSVPYRKYTRLMTKNLVEGIVGLLNDFPSKNGVSQTMSPSMIVTGAQMPDYNIKRIVFGSYAQVHLGTTNTMKHRSVPAIALRSSNESGGHYFMSLLSGKRIHSHNWTELPIDNDVIARVEELASKENQPELPNKSPIFEWAPGIEVEPIDEEDKPESGEDTDEISSNQHVQQNVLVENDNVVTDISDTEEENDDEIRDLSNDEEDSLYEGDIDLTRISTKDHSTESDAEMENAEVDESDDSIQSDDNNPHIDIEDISQDANENKSIASDDESDEEVNFTSECPPEILNNKEKDSDEETRERPKRKAAGAGIDRLKMRFDGKKYPDLTMKQFLQVTKITSQDSSEGFLKKCVDVVFTQMNAKKGFKKYGEVAVSAIIKEFRQLVHGAFPGKKVVDGVDPKTLTKEEKNKH